MPTIRFEGQDYFCAEDETLLDSLARHGVMLPSSCRAGACLTCMTRALKGTPPKSAQLGVKDTLAAQGYFLACLCKPVEDMEIGLASVSPRYTARLLGKDLLNESIVRLRLDIPEGFTYRAGQFVNLIRANDELTRSYSLASIPADSYLELHIKKVPEGRMSTWVFDEIEVGDELSFFGPSGDCFYLPGSSERPLLLAGAGTGLAPLYGILRDALEQGHAGPIHLFHASLATAGLYLIDELRRLADAHEQFHYTPCVLHGDAPDGGMQGNIVDIPGQVLGSLSGYRVFLCGDPPIVNGLRQKSFLAGASMQDIHSDPFVFTPA
ncbi:FAD-binding oxidoreductase [Mariprofundus ferrooxydans]|uniref:FAD-binding oxidoreductase n=1 Tax=Mariprofundus ferrooxydans TaxID=314344 RepID=UPI00035E0801|nr:2Fe-2S iron-sulfur cluster-binding protein [Mariprofundus ferrooxydans]